jgi:hypothetical protein
MAVTPTTFINKARSDQLVVNLLQHYGVLLKRLPLNDYLAKIKKTHTQIPSTKLIRNNSLTASSQRVAETAVLIQVQRSYVLDMKMHLFIELARLTEYIDSVRNHLTYAYYGAIISDYRVADVRKGVIDFILQLPINLQKRISTVIAYADLVINDLDKAGWNISYVTEALKQVSKDRLI